MHFHNKWTTNNSSLGYWWYRIIQELLYTQELTVGFNSISSYEPLLLIQQLFESLKPCDKEIVLSFSLSKVILLQRDNKCTFVAIEEIYLLIRSSNDQEICCNRRALLCFIFNWKLNRRSILYIPPVKSEIELSWVLENSFRNKWTTITQQMLF